LHLETPLAIGVIVAFLAASLLISIRFPQYCAMLEVENGSVPTLSWATRKPFAKQLERSRT